MNNIDTAEKWQFFKEENFSVRVYEYGAQKNYLWILKCSNFRQNRDNNASAALSEAASSFRLRQLRDDFHSDWTL